MGASTDAIEYEPTTLTSFADGDLFVVHDASTVAAAKVAFSTTKQGATPVACTAATLTVTRALHAGRTILLNRAGGIAVTLPAATGTGDVFRFFVQATFTSDATIKAASASDSFLGHAFLQGDDASALGGFACAANDDTLTMDGTTKGGYLGAWVEVEDVATGLFHVRYFSKATGTEATPFSATVS